MTDVDGFARRLVTARSSRGWSQQLLANASGVAAAQISRYESGRSNPRPALVARLSDALDVPFEWLFEGRDRQAPMFEDLEVVPTASAPPPVLKVAVSRELLDRLEAATQEAGHSLNAEIVSRLSKSFETDDSVPRAHFDLLKQQVAAMYKAEAASKRIEENLQHINKLERAMSVMFAKSVIGLGDRLQGVFNALPPIEDGRTSALKALESEVQLAMSGAWMLLEQAGFNAADVAAQLMHTDMNDLIKRGANPVERASKP